MPLPRATSHSRKPDHSPATAEVCGQLRSGNAHVFVDGCIRVVRDYNSATFPRDPIEVLDGALYIQATAVRSHCLADRTAPVVDAGKRRRAKTGARLLIGGWPIATARAF